MIWIGIVMLCHFDADQPCFAYEIAPPEGPGFASVQECLTDMNRRTVMAEIEVANRGMAGTTYIREANCRAQPIEGGMS